MVTKLKSALATLKKLLPLALKAGIFGLLLAYVQSKGVATTPLLFFVIGSFVLYAQPVFATIRHLFAYTILVMISLLAVLGFSASLPPAGLPVFFSILFFILLGVKNISLIHRQRWYSVLHFALMYAAGILFFASDKSQFFWVKCLFGFFFFLFLIRDYFKMNDCFQKPTAGAFAITIAFLLTQSLWLISLLPLGFVLGASLMIVMAFTLEETTLHYLAGQLTARMLRMHFIVFLILTFFITLISMYRP